jgi:hypothetical protein
VFASTWVTANWQPFVAPAVANVANGETGTSAVNVMLSRSAVASASTPTKRQSCTVLPSESSTSMSVSEMVVDDVFEPVW